MAAQLSQPGQGLTGVAGDDVRAGGAAADVVNPVGEQLDADGPAPQTDRPGEGGAETGEGVEDQAPGAGASFDDVIYDRGDHVDVLVGAGWSRGDKILVGDVQPVTQGIVRRGVHEGAV